MTCAWGEHGAAACAVENLTIMILRAGALRTKMIDTVGAGDSFNGAFLAALASGDDKGNDGALGRALRVASHVGGRRSGAWGFRGCCTRPWPIVGIFGWGSRRSVGVSNDC